MISGAHAVDVRPFTWPTLTDSLKAKSTRKKVERSHDIADEIIAFIPHLRRFALVLTRNRESADDLVQDCLLRATQRQKLFTPGTNLHAWLFTIMRNVFISDVRRTSANRQISLEQGDLVLSTKADQESRVELAELEACLYRLPGEQRETLLLVALEGFSYAEVSDVMGIPIGTVRSRVSRARETLRHCVQNARRSDAEVPTAQSPLSE